MPESLSEHIDRLRKLAEGALRTIDRRAHEDPERDRGSQRSFWQGYRQCLDDVEDFHNKHPDPAREETVT